LAGYRAIDTEVTIVVFKDWKGDRKNKEVHKTVGIIEW
jgi:hypothetical protein